MNKPVDRNWYVLYTKPRHEKKVTKRLLDANYTVYCPLFKVKRQWSDRIKVLEEPLFRGFVFVFLEEEKREEVLTFPGTVRYLFWLGKPAVVNSVEIESIQNWLEHFDHERIELEDIPLGTEVLITSGKFIHNEAILFDKSRNKAVVRLKNLGFQLSLDLNSNELLPIQW